MRYLDIAMNVFMKFVVVCSMITLLGLVASDISACPDKDRFVVSKQSGATYVCDRDGAISRNNALAAETGPPK
jgi:hypothetical protein